jgi:ABC-type multidrug transport system permease subunit
MIADGGQRPDASFVTCYRALLAPPLINSLDTTVSQITRRSRASSPTSALQHALAKLSLALSSALVVALLVLLALVLFPVPPGIVHKDIV